MSAQELCDLGEVFIEEADIVGDWQRPSFDITAATVGVFDGARLVAYAEVNGPDRGDAAVDPAYRGRGLGTQLATWMQDRARSLGSTVIGMPVPAGSPGDRLLEALRYHLRWTSWALELPDGVAIEARSLPQGYQIREATEADHLDLHGVLEDAFLEWSARPRQTFADFAATVLERPGFAPWMLRVVSDSSDSVVGVSIVLLAGEDQDEGFIDRLAVRVDQRRRGLAQALLVDSFAAARSRGATRSCISTDSRTGALALYEKVGMRVTSTWVHRAIHL
jgi:ribosomal protein S18 acetylase RimI-like enzyme